MLDKKYNPQSFEKKIFSNWEKNNFFYNQVSNPKRKFTIILPPPNVTGYLHLGHAWNVSIQDSIIRYKKIKGFNVNWICGMDHAGIATQTKYESYAKENKINKKNFSRDEWNKNIYEWSQENADKIRNQWNKMGLMLNYKNEFFTLDKNINEIVNDLFVKLYNDKLIYRSFTLVNWDIELKTAISNIEVIKKEVDTKLYYIKYKLEESNETLIVATTRPETMFADTCLVVNPKDKRFKKYIGKNAINPANKKKIPIISDSYIDIDYGTGIMKCTPAHDFNDYKIGKKYKQKFESCMNHDGTMNSLAGEYEGLDRIDCRKKMIDSFEKSGMIEKIEDQKSIIGFSERTGQIVEPMLSLQWFVKMKPLAKKALDLQKSNSKIKFYSNRFSNDLIKWLTNIEDWCISRQLTWGHRIPVWYDENGNIQVSSTKPKTKGKWIQDNDVFDTWFSSGTWPFSTSGFNFKNNDTKNIPTDVLVTAYDIIFFWVARMIMLSVYSTKKIPFKDVVIHGLIRDDQNRKMSKSLGNGIDPMEIIDKYGCDSLRLFLLSSSTPGEDLIFSEKRVQESSFFLNKLWNISLFISQKSFKKDKIEFKEIDKWIIGRFNKMIFEFEENFNKYNFNLSVKSLIKFVRDDFSSTYIELNKNRQDYTYEYICRQILKNILITLHPICPFTTDEIYLSIFNIKKSIILEKMEILPKYKESKKINNTLEVLEFIRKFKFDNSLKRIDNLKINVYFREKRNNKFIELLSEILSYENIVIENIFLCKCSTKNNINVFDDFTIEIIFDNKKTDNSNLIKEKEEIIFEIKRSEGMLSNENFVKKAPRDLVEKEKEKLIKNKKRLEEIENILCK